MKNRGPFNIDEGARRMIYCGAPLCVLVALTGIGCSLENRALDKVWPYVFLGTVLIVFVLGMIAYNFIPKRFILPLGIVGWLVSFAIMAWLLWFGRLSLGHTDSQW
jgi:hypothetical protein